MNSTLKDMRNLDPTAGSHDAGPANLPQMSDEDLLLRYRDQGDRAAFETLVHRYEKELFNYLRRYVGDATMAEDAFQMTFLQLHLKCDRFEEGRRVRPWLYTIATNQAIDAQRRNKRHRMVSLDRRTTGADEADVGALLDLLSGDEVGPSEHLEAEEREQWVRKAVNQLPEPLRAALTLVYYQGLKYREAAEVLGIPVGTVKSRLHTAILKLNEAWKRAHPQKREN